MKWSDDKKVPEKWSSQDWIYCALLGVIAVIVFFPGLSIRSLWGSEGRWAVIAREMFRSGNYFLPTINGEVYFDKPLLSYWVILPFYWAFGITEWTARVPTALAAVTSVLLLFAMGRSLFGRTVGAASAAMLVTSGMFVYWSRTASAEMLNLLGIWSMLFVYRRGCRNGSFPHLLLFYLIGALSCFCKGPVAVAVVAFVVAVSGLADVVYAAAGSGLSWPFIWKATKDQFAWLFSMPSIGAAAMGVCLFGLLLLSPIYFTGSWSSVSLMWMENVVRFLRPYDHTDPPYTYVTNSLIFIAPWSLMAVAAVWTFCQGKKNEDRRWVLATTSAIFAFFTLSGSRRGYYILPLLPALVLMTGEALSDLIRGNREKPFIPIRIAYAITAVIPALIGVTMGFVYFMLPEFRTASLLVLGPLMVMGGSLTIWLLVKEYRAASFILLVTLLIILEVWGVTRGMALVEGRRPLKPSVLASRRLVQSIKPANLAIFGGSNAPLIYYLDLNQPIRAIRSPDELHRFCDRPESYILTDEQFVPFVKNRCGGSNVISIVARESMDTSVPGDGFIILRLERKTLVENQPSDENYDDEEETDDDGIKQRFQD